MKILSTFCRTDPGGRAENEDACCVHAGDQNLVLVAADGLGGQGDGRAAADLAVEVLGRCGVQGPLPGEEQLRAAFDRANEAILAKQRNSRHMKTTAVYLCAAQDRAVWAHIGDSRLYHFFGGQIVEYTLDHSVSQMAVLLGEIDRRQIPGHADRSRLLRALGCEQIQPAFRPAVRLEKGLHGFLLCTDGFWEYVPEPYMEQSFGPDAERWGEAMCACLEDRCRPNHDNYTLLTACLEV